MSCGLCGDVITIDVDTRVWRCLSCHALCYVEPLPPHIDGSAAVADRALAAVAEALRRLAEQRARVVRSA
jgi:hypothetical protein